MRFQIRNDTEHREWVLEHTLPPTDRVDLIQETDGMVVKTASSGELVAQDIPGRIARFTLNLEPGTTYTIFLRFQSKNTMALPIVIKSQERSFRHESRRQLLIGVFFGLMIIMVLYNFLILISTRELTYLYYVLFVATHAMVQAFLLGVAQLYIWPMGTDWNNVALVLFGSLSLAFSAIFTREFLRTRTLLSEFSFVIDICLGLALVNSALAPVLPYTVGIQIMNVSLVIYAIVYIAAAVVVLKRGYKPARYYLLGWSLLAVAAVVLALKNVGLVPSTHLTNYTLQIGSILEVVLLSLALADRINVMRDAKLAAEAHLLASQREALRVTEEKLYFDNLTGLPNRNRLISDSAVFTNPYLILINVDQFRQINDCYGNKVGDEVILELMRRIQSFDPGVVSRLYKLHADEFAMVADGEVGLARRTDVGQALHDVCHHAPYSVNDRFVRLDVTIGIANGADSLLERADMALTEARRTHASVTHYDDSMSTKQEYENNLRTVGMLRDALTDDAIMPYCQPIVSNARGRIEKYECLMRIRSGAEIITPGSFLEIAKASKLYPELSRRLIVKSFDLFSKNSHDFSLNLSIDDILSADTIGVIRGCLDDCGRCESVVFEILESEGIERYELVSSFIEEMKDRGCGIAIDDFGSGYSNFEHILRLNVDYLKLDSSLVRTLDSDPQAKAIVAPIVSFSKSLGILTVAEFVHSEAVFQEVDGLKIDYSQGHFFGAPSPEPARRDASRRQNLVTKRNARYDRVDL